ncbi:hypothetical protein [Brucella intermedia]
MLTNWARQGVLHLCRGLPQREIIFVGDSSFAVHTLAAALPDIATLIRGCAWMPVSLLHHINAMNIRLSDRRKKGRPLPKLKTLLKDPKTEWQRIVASCWYGRQTGKALDVTSGMALWYRRGTPPRPIRWAIVKDPSGRREPQAFMSTNVNREPAQINGYFVRRWQIEVTFAETRTHLGVETQRQWNDKAIMRTTPSLLGLYSLVALWSCDLLGQGARPYAAAWYKKTDVTFSDAIGGVRRTLWDHNIYRHYPTEPDIPKIQKEHLNRMTQALCFAA